jgi:DNA replication protein DnaC
MLTSPTLEKLRAMKLDAMATAWEAQQQDPSISQLGFDERLGLLVDAEWLARENRRVTYALAQAKLKPSHACLEALDYSTRRGLDRSLIRQLATCRWIAEHQAVLILGPTGVGKSFLACALAHQACWHGHRVRYWRLTRLFHALRLAHADGSYVRLLGQLARFDVLILDDWGLAPLGDPERRDVLEILDDRYDAKATIITSQLAPKHWHEYIGDPTLADAICDRVLHRAHRIELRGESMRKTAPKTDGGTA